MRRLEAEAAPILQAAQQQQQGSQFSPVEQQIMREFPGVTSDAKKWNEALAAGNALVLRGYDRNSAAYDSALRLALGFTNADGIIFDDPSFTPPALALGD